MWALITITTKTATAGVEVIVVLLHGTTTTTTSTTSSSRVVSAAVTWLLFLGVVAAAAAAVGARFQRGIWSGAVPVSHSCSSSSSSSRSIGREGIIPSISLPEGRGHFAYPALRHEYQLPPFPPSNHDN